MTCIPNKITGLSFLKLHSRLIYLKSISPNHPLLLKHLAVLITLVSCCFNALASQDPVADSLNRLISITTDDTAKLRLMDDLVWWQLYSDMEQAYTTAHAAIPLSLATDDPLVNGRAHHTLGTIYFQINESDSAVLFFNRALTYFRATGIPDKVASSLNGLGNVYFSQGMHHSALKFYLEALKNADPENKHKVALINGNIGAVYSNMKNYAQSIKYTEQSLKLSHETGDSLGIASCLVNLGNCYNALGQYEPAYENFQRSLGINQRLNQTYRIAEIYNNMGVLAHNMGHLDSSAIFYQLAVKYYTQMNNPDGQSASMANLASIYRKLGKKEEARALLIEAEKISNQHYSRERLIGILGPLHEIYAEENNYPLAYDYLLRYQYLKDSVYGTESARQIAEIQTKYDLEKKEQEILLLNKETKLQEEQLHRQNLQRNALLTGLGLLTVFGIVITRSYRQKRLANRLLTEQKKVIEDAHHSLLQANDKISRQKTVIESRNRDITSSITYASRIQGAILPPPGEIRKVLPDSFILYLPKDIVSGDFYYFTSTPEYHFIAVADCTGHGVPGALVSMVCSNALDKAIREMGLTDPAAILNTVRKLVISHFSKGGQEDLKDGMDISLCAFSSDKSTMLWAGANNPLWIISPDQQGKPVLNEIKGDKQPVGLSTHMKAFTSHNIPVLPEAKYYLLSDGMADQFGGPRGKKLKAISIKQKLLAHYDTRLTDQHQEMLGWFNDWKTYGRDTSSPFEQVDDVCMIGFSLK